MATAEHLQHPEGPQEHVVSTSGFLGLSDRLQRLEERQRLLSHQVQLLEDRHRWLARLVLALSCALLVGGCYFFRLLVAGNSNALKYEYIKPTPTQQEYISPTPTQQTFQTSDEVSTEISPVAMKPGMPEKPAAHLKGPYAPLSNSSVVPWSVHGNAFHHEMDYKDGRLIVKQEGYYFLYSKIGLSDSKCVLVNHKMMRSSPIYGSGLKPIELMLSTRYHCPKKSDRAETSDVRSSYLGGVFHFYANDSIYVALEGRVRPVIRPVQTESFFGAFML